MFAAELTIVISVLILVVWQFGVDGKSVKVPFFEKKV